MHAYENSQRTRAFRLYEEGRRYNESLVPSYYTLVDTNTEFFAGNQWESLPGSKAMEQLPKPVFNIIRRVTGVLVAQITSGGLSVNLEPLSYYNGGPGTMNEEGSETPGFNVTEFAQAEVNNLIEKLGLEYRLRQALFDGAQTGDYCAHFYWNPTAKPYGGMSGSYRGEITVELVDGVNVMFGDPNTPRVEAQPYILLAGRDTVENLRQEYLALHPGDEAGARAIRPDRDYENQAASGGKLELTGEETAKCLYLYLYEKRPAQDGSEDMEVVVTKCTRNAILFDRAPTGLTRYPVAWGNWERQKNCYHGRALVTGILPNQIFINTMYAMVMKHLQLESFPKTIYNGDLVPRWDNEVGGSIAVHGLMPGQDMDQVATILRPTDMSGQILGTIDKVVELTRDCLGVTDVQMGTERADNTSAIMVVQQNAEVPLDNIRACLYEWVEDMVMILLDMMAAYYGRRPIVRTRSMDTVSTDPATGMPLLDPNTGLMQTARVERRVLEPFDFRLLRQVCLNARVDVGSSTAYSEIAMTQTLDNLREAGLISLEDYLERVPDKLIPRKQDLIDSHRRQAQAQNGIPAGNFPAGAGERGGEQLTAEAGTGHRNNKTITKYLFDKALEPAKVASALPGNLQAAFNGLPTSTKRTLARHESRKL